MSARPPKLDTNVSGRIDGGLVGTRYGMPIMSYRMDERRALTLDMLEIEGAVPWVISKHYPNVVPPEHGARIRRASKYLRTHIDDTLRKVDEREAVTHQREDSVYDVLREEVGDPARNYVHPFMTSADSSETAKGLMTRDGIIILIGTVEDLRDTCTEVARDWSKYKQMESTHGADALTRHLGRRLVTEAYALDAGIKRLYSDLREHAVGKVSGAVGDYHPMRDAGIDGPMIEKECCKLWKLRPVVSEQAPPREHIAYVMTDTAILGETVANIMRWVKYLKTTARGELREPPDEGQRGSSAMPHKEGNPFIEERVIGFADYKLVPTAAGMMLSVRREDARNLEASAFDRIDIPAAFILVDYSCALAKNVLQRCEPQPVNIEAGLWRVQGAVTSETMRYQLITRGMPEREARNVAAQLARKAGIEGRRFHDVLLEDGRVKQFLTPDEIRKYSDPAHYVGESGRIIEQAHEELFGKRILPKSLSIHSSLAPSR